MWLCICCSLLLFLFFFFFKQKTAYEMRISDWSSDVCSSDLAITNELVVDYYRAKGNSTVGLIYSLSPNGALPVIALTNFGNAAQFEGIISAFVAGSGGPPNAGAGAAAAYSAAHPHPHGRAACRGRGCQYV